MNTRTKSQIWNRHKLRCKTDFLLKANKFTTDPGRSPSSLTHLIIEIEIGSWHTSNLGIRKYNWEVARSIIHSRVIYINSSKKLNDYYAHRA
jgi:hypothetical protein